MNKPDTSLNVAQKAEWDTLRDEIARRDAQSFQIMTGSITVVTGLLTLFFTLVKDTGPQVVQGVERVIMLPTALYLIPFAIMLPALYLVINNAHAVTRIAGYIRTVLEPHTGLRWESALGDFYRKLRSPRWGAKPFEEAEVMFAVFVGLGLLNAVVFYVRGDWTWLPSGTLGQLIRWLLLAVPFPVYVDASHRLVGKRSARNRYLEVWKQVAADLGAQQDVPKTTE
jgi:hypothetical protein